MHRIKSWTRTHKVAAAILTTLVVCAATALAFYLLQYEFSGAGKAKIGNTAATTKEPLTVAPIEIAAISTNTPVGLTAKPAKEVNLEPGAKAVVTVSPSSGLCEVKVTSAAGSFVAELLAVGGTTVQHKLLTTGTSIPGLEVFEHNASENQQSCIGTEYEVKVTITGGSQ